MNQPPAVLHPHFTCSSNPSLSYTNKTIRILRLKQVLDRVGISRAQLYMLKKDGRFPQNFSLSGPSGRAVGWLESDIDNWVASRAEQQIKVEVQ